MLQNERESYWALLGLGAPYDSSDVEAVKALLSEKGSSPFVIAADGGCDLIASLNLCPDVVIGDMDSISDGKMENLRKRDIPFIIHPKEKDKTDSQLAFEFAKNLGYDEMVLMGALGGRLDHTIANISMIGAYLLESEVDEVRLIGGGHEIIILRSQATVSGKSGETVSLIPLTPTAEGVTITGFHYPLDNAVLKWSETLGVSNYLEKEIATIRIRSGILLAIRRYC
ncbi:MAG: thiamine diphosphokinase [Firmicutes bacterium]|nr:thiamine diphosphokinase [Bacillota bacterium]